MGRLTGPALSVAKALAAMAPWDNFLGSWDVVRGQEDLAPLWEHSQAWPQHILCAVIGRMAYMSNVVPCQKACPAETKPC
jgi:hypothetical protein